MSLDNHVACGAKSQREVVRACFSSFIRRDGRDSLTVERGNATVTLPESLVPGTYYVRETSAKEPYLVGEEIEVNIPADMNLTPVAVEELEGESG